MLKLYSVGHKNGALKLCCLILIGVMNFMFRWKQRNVIYNCSWSVWAVIQVGCLLDTLKQPVINVLRL